MTAGFRVLAAAFLSLASPGLAQESLSFPTRSDVDPLDLKRVAALAESAQLLADRLTYQLLAVSPESCVLSEPCAKVANEIVQPLAVAARDLSALARAYDQAPVSNQYFAALRIGYFDPIARKQAELRHTFLPHGRSGSLKADLACQDLLDAYWILLHQVVAHPREFGGNEGGRDTD